MSLHSSHAALPGLAIVANCLTPYRIHLHELIAAGIPELKVHTLVTHDDADFKWEIDAPAVINVSYFGRKGDSPLAGPFSKPCYEWRKGKRLIRYLAANGVTAVICNSYRYLSYLRVIRHCHRTGLPIFVNNDSNLRSEPEMSAAKAWAKRHIYKWWLTRVTGVMPMGGLGERFFLKYGANARRFYRVPYTPDYEGFAAIDAERVERFCRRLGLNRERRYLLFSGRLAQVKRVDLLIDAFAKLAADRPNWDLIVAGDGPLRDDLQRRVPEGLRLRVVWTGFLEQIDLKLAYQAADVLVLPSDHEPWAVVVQEAMAAGLVVVASDVVGAAHELIEDQISGRIFQRSDVNSLRKAILDVTDNEKLARYKDSSGLALAAWRARTDAVGETRRALVDAGVLG